MKYYCFNKKGKFKQNRLFNSLNKFIDTPYCILENNVISFKLNGGLSKNNGPAYFIYTFIYPMYFTTNDKKQQQLIPRKFLSREFWLDGKKYGYNDDYTNKSWKRFTKLIMFQ